MDTQRLILFLVFAFSVLFLWEAWQKQHSPTAVVSQQGQPALGAARVPSPEDAVPAAPSGLSKPVAAPASGQEVTVTRAPVTVKTDLLRAVIDPLGGDLVELELLKAKDTTDPSKNFVLLSKNHRYAAQSGFIGAGLPTHRTLYSVATHDFALKEGEQTLEVRLETKTADGWSAAKIFTFHRGSYEIGIEHEVLNRGSGPLSTDAYFQLTRDENPPPGDQAMVKTFTGVAAYTDEHKYQKISFSDIEKDKNAPPKSADNGWIGIVQHYFVSAWLPPQKAAREFYVRKLGEDLFSAGVIVPVPSVGPGQTARVAMTLYAGPQEQEKLAKLAPGLDLVVDYGWLTIIASPLFWVLKLFHRWLENWGLAIIALTVLIKLVFFPLSAASYRSMAKMKLVAPRLTRIREQYADDRVKMNQAMMELYKTEKINPLGGCLPIVVQIPVFISLYWVLLGSVELRFAPFYGWIKDLSSADPYFVLPSLMMLSMIVQTKMNPTPPDPVQAKVMMIMPFVFGVMFFFFPAGLVLYWLVNNLLSIAQQWQISRMMGGASPAKR